MDEREETARFWARVEEVCGTTNPTELAYFTGLSSATISRYQNGEMKRGPALTRFITIRDTIAERKGVRVTLEQLWGTAQLDPVAPALDDAVRDSEAALTLGEDSPQSDQESLRPARGQGRGGRSRKASS